MNFPLFIACRYLFARKSTNVINVISGITIAGIALASMAMICTLSVFNGFRGLMASLFTGFDPDIRITAVHGKVFDPESGDVARVGDMPFVESVTYVLEDQALAKYKSSQQIVTVKGVESNFREVYDLEGILSGSGQLILSDEVCEYGIMGIGLMHRLDCGVQPVSPVGLYAPIRGSKINMSNPAANFTVEHFYSPGVVFQVSQPQYDDNYVIVPMTLARRLFGYDSAVSAVDIRLSASFSKNKAKKELKAMLGGNFCVQDRYEQQADVFKVIRLEKFISYLFLSFILLIACFNIIGSLVMLILEKRNDSSVLVSLGLAQESVGRIFVLDGLLISVTGAGIGLLIGVMLALAQQYFGFIPLGSNGGFVVDYYPVSVKLTDVLAVLLTVTVVTLITLIPIRNVAVRYRLSQL